jgi:hypothetical protein
MERREKVNACRELARRSGQHISFDPDRWGENMLDSMEKGLQVFLEQLPEEVRPDYEDRYIEKYKEWLYAMSRCFSQAITGAGGWKPATFRRHEKTNAAEKAALERLEKWCEKVIKRSNRQGRLTGWAEVERLQDKIDTLTALQERMKAANKIIRSKKLAEVEKVDELVAIGFTEENAMKLMEPSGWWGAGFAPFQLSNNNARIKDAEARMKQHTAMAQAEDVEQVYPWGTFRKDFSDERYRFIFDGKPAQEVIYLMKHHAFKWSRANMAWQRQITPNSTYTVKYIILPKLQELYDNAK